VKVTQSIGEDSPKTDVDAGYAPSGLNDNLEFMGKQLHVQTERICIPSLHIITQVFSNGRVILSKRTGVARDSGAQEPMEIQHLMRTQHFHTIREIEDKQKSLMGSNQALAASKNQK
jgi:hypothetical protein